MTNTNRKFFGSDIDWLTIFLWLALCVIGWFNIHAAVYDIENPSILSLNTNYGKQFIFILSAIVLGVVILVIDSRFYSSIAPVFYVITLLLLIVVLFIGRNVGGNQAWIELGLFRLQPSEFAKLAACLMLAKYLNINSTKNPNLQTLAVGILLLLIPVILIMLQPDTGSALTFFALIFVFYREGYVPGKVLLIGGISIALFVLTLLYTEWIVIAIVGLLTIAVIYFSKKTRSNIISSVVIFISASIYVLGVDFAYNNILQSHQRNRVEVLLGKIDDPRGEGYNVNQSLIAIGSGQLLGKGYLEGTQTKYNFVPEQSTDFIFCTIGEEWGFVGSATLVLIYVGLLLRLIHIAERQRSSFARIYGYGVVSILFFHFFINIGMTLGIVPVIGIPLPFISYGGSSLWSFTILLFILIKLDANRKGLFNIQSI
ncbi:rod shape-determining protein RodA [Albibacterium bauzanense]|uniref:Cell wall polymerase n=1 Tax=Albibacterium bauzanense TaxID=653929 RepID=A0A4R1M0P6_9SPHI|nr:rod shape-determining protein RodA [Albibacterium bauzanense]TCK85478.1 rod shape determining protein RodA [Albibacterium bauzanense]